MRLLSSQWQLFATAIMTASITLPAAAAELHSPVSGFYKLPLKGNYGNESGCNALAGKTPVVDDMEYVTAEEYRGWETNCRFSVVYDGNTAALQDGSQVWTVIMSCAGEGEAYSRLVTVHELEDSVTITEGDKEPKSLHRCNVTQAVPKEVSAFSDQLEAECASQGHVDSPSSSQLTQAVSEGPYGKLFVVDGAYTQCGDTGPFCGTGGCRTGVFNVKGGIAKKLYDDQALGWKISENGLVLTLNVHGSKCGGVGPDRCVTEIDLRTGRKKTFQPH